ncbi:hypothetical protein LT337_00265 [Mycolicibacterium fortuitum]|nr:hypothetical protein LT337_00265 [Mycolicibacterium fortuitum]
MGVGLAHNREALEAALAGHVTVTATLADIDFTAFDTAELLALQSEREQHARTQAMIDHRIQSALMARATRTRSAANPGPMFLPPGCASAARKPPAASPQPRT